MEQTNLTQTAALIAEIKGERASQDLTVKELSERSGIPVGTLNRMFGSEPREVGMSQIAGLSRAFGITAAELVARAEARYARMTQAD